MKKELNKHDKMVVRVAIQEALKLGKDKTDFVQFKIGKKVFKIKRLFKKDITRI